MSRYRAGGSRKRERDRERQRYPEQVWSLQIVHINSKKRVHASAQFLAVSSLNTLRTGGLGQNWEPPGRCGSVADPRRESPRRAKTLVTVEQPARVKTASVSEGWRTQVWQVFACSPHGPRHQRRQALKKSSLQVPDG